MGMKPYVVDGVVMVKRMAVTLVAGMFLGAAVAAAGYKVKEVPESIQKKALRTCYLPQAEGEMTIYVVENGKIKCWRWK
jgi:hypothetical protein